MHASMVSRYERSKAENLLLLLLFVLVFSSRPFLLFVLSAPKNVPVAFLDIDLNVVFVNFKFLAFCSKSTSKSHELAVDLGLFLSSFADIFFFSGDIEAAIAGVLLDCHALFAFISIARCLQTRKAARNRLASFSSINADFSANSTPFLFALSSRHL